MVSKRNNFAFIDTQNLTRSLFRSGWKIDRNRFRIFLQERYGVSRAFLCVGYVSDHVDMYNDWKDAGFEFVFKETYRTKDGSIKGNCDAELVLETLVRASEYEQAIIITGDGDLACLVRYLREQNKLERLLVPVKQEYSFLLRKAAGKAISYISDVKNLLVLN